MNLLESVLSAVLYKQSEMQQKKEWDIISDHLSEGINNQIIWVRVSLYEEDIHSNDFVWITIFS